MSEEKPVVEVATVPVATPTNPVAVTGNQNHVLLMEKYAGGCTWVLIVFCCFFIGPFALLFLCCPLDDRQIVMA
eukprot:snap_masked-scaffold_11-processed-gene-8.9-mRNA-1 protein AED:1.00 eAED:1.00 QI:0/-1/0/0/-1/1/1/0/73